MDTRPRPLRGEAEHLGDLGRSQPNGKAQSQQLPVGRRQAAECHLEIRQISREINGRRRARCRPGFQRCAAPLPSTRLPSLVGADSEQP